MKRKNKLVLALTVGFILYNEYKKRTAPKIFFVNKLFGNYNAQTIPPFGIFINKKHKNNIKLLAHELIHWKQYQKKGLIGFYYQYFSELNRYGYDAMPMEIEARFDESEFCKKNYTHCVQNGISNTISDVNFRK